MSRKKRQRSNISNLDDFYTFLKKILEGSFGNHNLMFSNSLILRQCLFPSVKFVKMSICSFKSLSVILFFVPQLFEEPVTVDGKSHGRNGRKSLWSLPSSWEGVTSQMNQTQ